MQQDSSTHTGGQEPPDSPNQRSVDFLNSFTGLEKDGLFLAGSIPNDKALRVIGRYTDEKLLALPDNERHHVTGATFPASLKNRDDSQALTVPFIVFDDVGRKFAAPAGATSITAGVEVDEDLFQAWPVTTWQMETRDGRHQYGYHFIPALESAIARHVINELKARPEIGAGGLHAIGQYFRLPSGTNTKPDGKGFRTKLIDRGPSITLEDFCAGFGIDLDKVAVRVASRRAQGEETLSAKGVRALLELFPNENLDYDTWIKVGHSIWGATGGSDEGLEVFIWWSSQSAKFNLTQDTEKTWDSFSNAGASASTLRVLIEEKFGVNSMERELASQIFAGEAFDEVKDAAGVAGAFELSEWNPWAASGGVDFPLETLPETVRDYISERSVATGSDAGAFALSVLTCFSTALDHRIKLQPKTWDSYQVSPLLWALLVGDPSTRKSAPIETMERLLGGFDHRDAQRRQFDVQDHMNLFGVSYKEADDATPPSRRRVLYDTTTEKLCSILSRQDCGCGLYRDELSGWIGAMDKYAGGGNGPAQDRSVWIKAHGGGRYIQDRVKDTRLVNNLSVAILGAIQPQRLAAMGQLDSDGLLQRFLPVIMAPAVKDRDVQASSATGTGFRTLVEALDRMSPVVLTLSPEAQAVRQGFADEMVIAARLKEPSESFGSFMGKQERTFCVMCLILHMLEVAEGRARVQDPVSETLARNALLILEAFVIPHAWQFYALVDSKWTKTVSALAADLVKHKGRRIVQTQLRSQVARGLSLREFQDVMRVFQANGWAIADNNGPLNNHWTVNPSLDRFVSELEAYMEMCENVSKKIAKSRAKVAKI